MTPDDYPFIVNGAGSPSMFAGYDFTGAVLAGDLTAHHGVVLLVPCRIVEDPASPLRFIGIGEQRFAKKGMQFLDATTQWVVLAAEVDVLRAYTPLFGKQVRIEYAPTVTP